MAHDPSTDENKEAVQDEDGDARQKILDEILKNEAMCDESRKLLQDPHVVFIIRRSKNQNVVVYTANMKDGKIDPENPLSVFWLKIEPSYVEKNRAKGKKDDRTELTFLENNMAYGIYQEKIDGKPGEYKITFVAMKARPAILKLNKDGLPRCHGKLGDVDAHLVSMYCNTTESWFGLPTVNYVLMAGTQVCDGKHCEEKVTQ